MIIFDFDQVPHYFISASLTDNQKEIIAIKYYVFNNINASQALLPQFKEMSQTLIDQGINISYKGISKYYYETK